MDKQTYIELFSKTSIDSYTSINEHEKNFEILGNIAPKLARIEIIVRNRIDGKMRKSYENWLWHLPDSINLDDDSGNVKDRDTLVSRQTFGFWIKVAKYYKIESNAFNDSFLDGISFKNIVNSTEIKLIKDLLEGGKITHHTTTY